LTIAVNDLLMGTTDPIPAEYDKKAVDTVLVTAVPNSGFNVKNWELNGTQYPSNLTFSVKCYRDYTLLCVFWKGQTQALRPNANGDLIELTAVPVPPDYQCVDEEISDGDASVVTNVWNNTQKIDLYQLSDTTFPSNYIVDYVDVFARVRRRGQEFYPKCNMVLKTNNQIVHDIDYMPIDVWGLITKRYTLNPVTGLPWTIAEVNALQAGIRLECIVGSWHTAVCDCTQLWVEVVSHAP
jgi:hypothetical protein